MKRMAGIVIVLIVGCGDTVYNYYDPDPDSGPGAPDAADNSATRDAGPDKTDADSVDDATPDAAVAPGQDGAPERPDASLGDLDASPGGLGLHELCDPLHGDPCAEGLTCRFWHYHEPFGYCGPVGDGVEGAECYAHGGDEFCGERMVCLTGGPGCRILCDLDDADDRCPPSHQCVSFQDGFGFCLEVP